MRRRRDRGGRRRRLAFGHLQQRCGTGRGCLLGGRHGRDRHAILHQVSHERNEEGHIVATLDDYARVRDLVDDLISEGIEATVPQSVREVVEAAVQLHEEEDEPVTTAALSRELELDRTAASRRVRSAKDRGYLRDLEDNPRKPSRIVPGDPLPEELAILPAPETLAEACTRAVQTEGINTPLPPQTRS